VGSLDDGFANARCESFFNTPQCESPPRRGFTSQAEVGIVVFGHIEGWRIRARRHTGGGWFPPIAYEASMTAAIVTS
jgi:transposase InsO family protein